MPDKKITFIDLFSGAGGLTKGLEMAGLKCSGAMDYDNACQTTHKRNFPECPFYCGSIKNINPISFAKLIGTKKVDVIAGGPPCPTFSNIGRAKIKSIAGKKGLEEDERNFLFRDFFRYVNFFKPKLVLIENVPGFMTRYEGKILNKTKKCIEKLGFNFDAKILNAADFGVPQKRKRMILVATKKKFFSFPEITHCDDSLPLFNNFLRKHVTVWEAISDLPKIKDDFPNIKKKYSVNNGLSQFQKQMRNGIKNNLVANNRCRFSNKKAKKIFSLMKEGQRYFELDKKIQNILGYDSSKFGDKLKRLKRNKASWTVIAHLGVDGYMYIHPTQNRTISVREAARLQSFPDDFIFKGSMHQMYTQVGNAVPVLMAKALGESIQNFFVKN